MGLSMQETLTVPFSVLLDLIAVEQIKNEGARQRRTAEDATAAFEELLTWR